jgi:hypothetical protein
MTVNWGDDIWDSKDRTVGTAEAGTAETGWTGQVSLVTWAGQRGEDSRDKSIFLKCIFS